MRSYKDLISYQKSLDLVIFIYSLVKTFPREEMYALCDQLRRAVVSIPSNIAEGAQRGSRKEYVHFLRISFGSCSEVETQLLIAYRLKYIGEKDYVTAQDLTSEVSRMILGMIRKLSTINYEL